MFNITECDAIMIGRGAMGNPWLFGEIIDALEGKEYVAPTVEDKISIALEQLKSMIELKGERIGIAEGKKHMGWYISGMVGAASMRNRIMTASSYDEIKNILEEILV